MAAKDGGPGMAQVASQLLQDSLHNIVHDILLDQHREHKTLLASLDPITKLPTCDKCTLPRLLKPTLAPSVRGAAAEPPRDTQYCELRPWSRRAGHDIYDNPFPKMDVTGRPPKPGKAGRKDTDSQANDDASGTAPPSPSADGDAGAGAKLEKGEKKASKIDEKLRKGEYVPWQTCPACKRSLLITRFAKHLEQCMGLSGRMASRNAIAKMNGGSRAGTPSLSQDAGRQDDDDDDDSDEKTKGSAAVRRKVLRKGIKDKLLKKEKTGGANGKLPKSSPPKRVPSGFKRDRDDLRDGDDDDTVHVKKRQKMQRVASTASFASQSMDMDVGESVDGSFVDDGSGDED